MVYRRDILGHNMAVIISMLRGVNVGGHNKIKREALRELYLRSDERDITRLTKQIEDGIERKFDFRPSDILRTVAEMREVVARNPFAKRRGIEPSKLLVTFLASDPEEEAREKVRQMKCAPEELRIEGRELTSIFPTVLDARSCGGQGLRRR